ncbi:MAG: manganese efflux pump MntP family protein [Bacteroidales bacterium]
MGVLEIIMIAIGLSMDSLAVSIAAGIILDRVHVKHIFRIAFWMGLFQGVMPLLGWLLGIRFQKYIEVYDHWVAFILLSLLGGKMIYEWFSDEEDEEKGFDPTRRMTIIGLAIATSIDALAVGVSFAFLNVKLLIPIVCIGVTTFILSFSGAAFGAQFGNRFRLPMELIGGIILILIGFKILIEHIYFM